VRVSFEVSSHLDDTREVPYVVTVAGHPHPGRVAVDPGETSAVTTVVERPKRDAYEIRVELPDDDREVFAHCGTAS
jgi:hypothetical protein